MCPMVQAQYNTLLEVLTVLPDPRKARGQRYAWSMLLALLAAGLYGQCAAGTHSAAQWVAGTVATCRVGQQGG